MTKIENYGWFAELYQGFLTTIHRGTCALVLNVTENRFKLTWTYSDFKWESDIEYMEEAIADRVGRALGSVALGKHKDAQRWGDETI